MILIAKNPLYLARVRRTQFFSVAKDGASRKPASADAHTSVRQSPRFRLSPVRQSSPNDGESADMASVQTLSTIESTIDGRIAIITLNRPDVRNAVNESLRAEFVAAIAAVASDDRVRAVVLTGNGPAFCAGGDLAAMQQNLGAAAGQLAFNGWQRQRRLHEAVDALHRLTKPTIAAVNGPAVGLGCDLALCCDFILAAEQASFAMSFILRGLIPDGGGLYFLPRRVGLARAKELIFTGRRVEAKEALAIGLVDRVTSSSDASRRGARLGGSAQPGLDRGARAHQGNPQQNIRARRRGRVRAWPAGAGDLLYDRRAPRSREGISRKDDTIKDDTIDAYRLPTRDALRLVARPRGSPRIGLSSRAPPRRRIDREPG